jgi:hypothetical protein
MPMLVLLRQSTFAFKFLLYLARGGAILPTILRVLNAANLS